MDDNAPGELLSDTLVDAVEVVFIQIEPDNLLVLVIDLGSVMAHIGLKLLQIKEISMKNWGTYVEASQIWDVIEGNLFDAELESTFSSEFTEGTAGGPLSVLDSQLALVTHLFQLESLLK